jgi:hypothetical protein
MTGMVALSPMLPVPIQFIVAMFAYAINERMARRLEYVQEEVRVLREALAAATGRTRIAFAPEQRRRLALKGKVLTPQEREGCRQIVRPSTILAWFRKLAARKYDGSGQRRKPGRPRKPNDIRELVIWLANENLGWGYTKIRDALRGLKIDIGRSAVASILAEAGIEPAPERGRRRTWKQFVKSHWQTLYACDFFAVETLRAFGTVRVTVFFVVELHSRAVHTGFPLDLARSVVFRHEVRARRWNAGRESDRAEATRWLGGFLDATGGERRQTRTLRFGRCRARG